MHLFDHPDFDGHEQVVFCSDAESGLRAIIAVHDTTLGPSLGGCRMWPYANDEEALRDVLRLSRGMTYKSALAGLPLGGGKSVIIGNPRTDKSEALLRAMGRNVERLGGRYIVAEDSGTGKPPMSPASWRRRPRTAARAAATRRPPPLTACSSACRPPCATACTARIWRG